MKHLSDLVHGLRLLHQLKQEPASNPENELGLATFHLAKHTASQALQVAPGRRALEDSFFGSGGSDAEGDGGLLSFFGGGDDDYISDLLGDEDFAVTLEECKVDVDDLMAKAFGAFLMKGGGGDMMGGIGLGSEEKEQEEEGLFGSLGFDPFSFLNALKDDDEKECNTLQSLEIVTASTSYLKCTAVDQFFDMEAIAIGDMDFFEEIEEGCLDLMGMVDEVLLDLELDLEDPRKAEEAAFSCGKAVLGDNPLGNYIRYAYLHVDSLLECMGELSDALPHCVLSAPDGSMDIQIPLSVEKKLLCVTSKTYPMIIEKSCLDLYDGLNSCLPKVDAAFEDEQVRESCLEENVAVGKFEFDTGFDMDASVITGNKIPGYCIDAFTANELDTASLLDRNDYYNSNRAYGWTFSEVKAPDVSTKKAQQVESKYHSNKDDISTSVTSKFADGITAEASTETSSETKLSYAPIAIGLIAVALISIFIVRRNMSRHRNFSHVANENLDHLELEESGREIA